MLRQKQTSPTVDANTGPKAHSQEKGRNTATARLTPLTGTDTRTKELPTSDRRPDHALRQEPRETQRKLTRVYTELQANADQEGTKTPTGTGAQKQPEAPTRLTGRKTHPRALNKGEKTKPNTTPRKKATDAAAARNGTI